MEEIPIKVLERQIEGINLSSNTLGEQIKDKSCLLVFLRYKGCIFCPQMVKDIRAISENNPEYPEVFFIFQGSKDEASNFFNKHWPNAKAICDPERLLYPEFKIQKATISQLLGQKVWIKGMEAMFNGNFGGIPIGDLRMMPGLFLIKDNKILWKHTFEHIGDHPDFCGIPEIKL